MTQKNIFFRVDSSFCIGFGHLNRCLILAEIFKKRKINVHFICKNLKGNVTNEIKVRGYNLHLIKNTENSDYQDYLNTRKILQKFETETCYLVIDNYHWNEKYEKKIRFLVEKIIVIDDLANRKHDCDLLIDQNLYSNFEHRYDKLVPKNCQKLLGPKYILLRKEFLRSKKKTRINSIKKIFVSFGGQDVSNETVRVLSAIKKSKLNYQKINFLINKSNSNLKNLKKISKNMKGVVISTESKKLSKLIQNSDLSIGAGGSMTWERAYLGIPSIVSILSKNQIEITKSMEKKGCIYNMGWSKNVKISDYQKILDRLVINELNSMSQKNRKVVDGKGISRIDEKIFSKLIKL
tara:strand:- start:898 stop:1947 length:1050 start_codon:yes stop_codon:yes gene_type:complete